MPDKFDILIQDLERVRANGSSFGVFGEDSHGYELQHSTVDLVKDTSKIVASTSRYPWQAPSPFDRATTEVERLQLGPHLDYYNLFKIHTIDGWTYYFDATIGKIKSTVRTKG